MVISKTRNTVRSVSQFVSRLNENSSGELRLFRGQDTDKVLLPRIMRLAKENQIAPSEIDSIEQKMLERFMKESVPMLQDRRKCAVWELMAIAQHWGMPTRLLRLDWECAGRTLVRGCERSLSEWR